MQTPKMILFDYGGTLIYEPDWDPHESVRALYSCIEYNPHNVTYDELDDFVQTLFHEIQDLRSDFIEIHEHIFLRYILEYFDLKLSLPVNEAEWLMWNGMSEGAEMPGASEMLKMLEQKGIRTGIISNLCWSAETLKRRLDDFFPEHKFEFIMTSSEYIFRKPDRHIFELALRKSGLDANEVWFAGNSLYYDIIPSHNAGIQPVYFDEPEINKEMRSKSKEIKPDFSYIHISHWNELEKILLT